MNEMKTVAFVLGLVASVCTIWMFVEDRFRKFRLRKRGKKMGLNRKDG